MVCVKTCGDHDGGWVDDAQTRKERKGDLTSLLLSCCVKGEVALLLQETKPLGRTAGRSGC